MEMVYNRIVSQLDVAVLLVISLLLWSRLGHRHLTEFLLSISEHGIYAGFRQTGVLILAMMGLIFAQGLPNAIFQEWGKGSLLGLCYQIPYDVVVSICI